MIHHAAVLAQGTDQIRQALAHVEACHYQLHAIVQDWRAAYDLLQAGLVSVIVVASRDVWAPRIEYADRCQQPITTTSSGAAGSRWRRARRMRH